MFNIISKIPLCSWFCIYVYYCFCIVCFGFPVGTSALHKYSLTVQYITSVITLQKCTRCVKITGYASFMSKRKHKKFQSLNWWYKWAWQPQMGMTIGAGKFNMLLLVIVKYQNCSQCIGQYATNVCRHWQWDISDINASGRSQNQWFHISLSTFLKQRLIVLNKMIKHVTLPAHFPVP